MAGDRGEVVARLGGDRLCRRAPALIERGRKDQKRHGDRDEHELANDNASPCGDAGNGSAPCAAPRIAPHAVIMSANAAPGEPESKRGV